MDYKLPGDGGSFYSIETLPPVGLPHVGPHGQHQGSLLCQSPEQVMKALALFRQAQQILLFAETELVSLRTIYLIVLK